MSHVKRERSSEAESSSLSSKGMPSAASDDSGSKCNPVVCKLVLRYRQILPNAAVEKKSHLLSNVGSRNPKVGACLCFNFCLFYKLKERRQILINV